MRTAGDDQLCGLVTEDRLRPYSEAKGEQAILLGTTKTVSNEAIQTFRAEVEPIIWWSMSSSDNMAVRLTISGHPPASALR